MSLSIFSIDPQNGKIDAPIDSKIVVEFDQAVDPFTIEFGVSIYVLSEGLWSGPDLSQLDSKYSDVLSVGTENTYLEYTWELLKDGSQLVISPKMGLIPNRKHFIQILPGNDVTRYVSAKTWGDPIYSKIDLTSPNIGTIKVLSSYTGKSNATYTMDLSASASGAIDTVDVVKDGVYVGGFKTTSPVNLGDITLEFEGTWDAGDSIELDVFAASGVTDIYQTSFTTNEYNTVAVSSYRIESIEQTIGDPLLLVDSTPRRDSINNNKMNPIVLKFNKPIDPAQDLSEMFGLLKVDMETGEERKVKFVPVVNGNVVKLYLNSVE